MEKNRIHFQLVWGILLTLMGIAFFFKIPEVINNAKTIETLGAGIGFVYFCLYMIDLILIVGGIKKIYTNLKKLREQ
jgi:uncharacterized membrane protein HdeD (DUF308 family)